MEAPLDNARIMRGEQCPYCGDDTEFIDSDAVYSKTYGMIYICRPCQAWVGVHKSSRKALGRLADKRLREAKQMAHQYFDQLWRRKMRSNGVPKSKARAAAYEWLAKQMGKPIEETHIGMFDNKDCELVIFYCKPYYSDVY